MANQTGAPTGQGDQASMAELVERLSQQTTRLIRQEMELARTELTAKGKRAGIGAGMFGGAGAFGFYALGALIATAILGLATAVARVAGGADRHRRARRHRRHARAHG